MTEPSLSNMYAKLTGRFGYMFALQTRAWWLSYLARRKFVFPKMSKYLYNKCFDVHNLTHSIIIPPCLSHFTLGAALFSLAELKIQLNRLSVSLDRKKAKNTSTPDKSS